MQLLGGYWLFWFFLGFFLLIFEVLTPGVVLVFFGLGAWTVMGIILIIPLPPVFQWILFISLSLIYLILLRQKCKSFFYRVRKGRDDSLQDPLVAGRYIGREVDVVEDISPHSLGQVEFDGSNWQARSRSNLSKGVRARIVEVEDLTFWVEPV
jgi:membrane protein implicated in regulation of membrane protease activity